jgi:hypothetical protein
MEPKQIEITCPCCQSRILLDTRTEKILRTRKPESLDEAGRPKVSSADWDSAVGTVKGREATRSDKLDSALDREKNRASELDERFRKASEKLRERPDEDD